MFEDFNVSRLGNLNAGSFNWGVPGGMTTTLPDLSMGMPGGVPPVGSSGWGGIEGLGKNMDTLKLGLSGLGAIGNIWAAFKAQKLANEQFKYTKAITDINLNNQMKSYNTALEDKARSRAVMESQTPEQMAAYINANSLRR